MKNYEIDSLISLMKDMIKDSNDLESELVEQEPAAGAAGGGGDKPVYPTVTKWESGATRGPANQIGLTKWRDIVKVTRGKANTLL